jgi:tetratricopeptide (TPR) repeat protein
MERKQYREAAESFRRVTQLNPQSAEGHTNLASVLYLLQDYPGCLAALDQVAALGADTAGTYFLRAITLDKMQQKAGALENYRRFVEVNGAKNPDQEFQARQRIRVLQREVRR